MEALIGYILMCLVGISTASKYGLSDGVTINILNSSFTGNLSLIDTGGANITENTVFLMFPENTRFNQILKILMTSKTDTEVRLFSETPSLDKDIHIQKNSETRTTVLAVSQLSRGIMETKAIQVTPITNVSDVSVYGVSHYDCCSTDGFYGLPYKNLGTSYMAMTYHAPQNSFVSILAVHPNTEVNVTLNTTGPVSWQGHNLDSGSTVRLNMNRRGTVEILHDHDLTGTTVNSNKPVAVMSGNTCSNVLGATCNHLVEYLPPVSSYGKTFLIPTIKTASQMIVRVTPSVPNTTVTFYDYRGPHELRPNGTLEIKLLAATLYLVKCDVPCLVTQYAIFTQRHPAPFMTLVPAREHFDNSYTFITPDVVNFNHYITVVTSRKHADDIKLNGYAITQLRYVEKHLLDADGDLWISLSVPVPGGVNTVEHTPAEANVGFGAIGYGFKPYDAYAYPLGMKLKEYN